MSSEPPGNPNIYFKCYISVKFSSVAQSCPTLCDTTDCRTPGIPVHHQLPKLAQTYVHLGGDAIQPLHPPLSPSPPAFSLSQHPFNEHSRLISFRINWLDLLAVQVTLKSLLQYLSSKASIVQCSVFFIVQFSHPYIYI